MALELPSEELSKRTLLPEKPLPVTLFGKYVYLEPLIIERDAEKLFDMSNGKAIHLNGRSLPSYDSNELIWRYMMDGPFESIHDFGSYLQTQVNAPNGLCLCVFDVLSNNPIGVVNMMNNFPAHLKLELGTLWYSPIAQKTVANTEATYLMLTHAFALGYRRLEWKCHSHNERSRKAALRLGFKFEGIHESHMIIKGCNRDTAWFRILASEWADVRKNLESLLNSFSFNS